ncbi:unnamed protein product [Parnassius apollo]|uniref:(apollo) hypothetical protein n=1 Tax=Parnassius apollo TaxID=110799 RepID=A0A8S3XRN0_PARAO|nr:unnamed protein product [Parnassius apollo]
MATMDLTNEVVRLRAELEKVSAERDMLLCEVSNLRRELELSELKQLQDDRGDKLDKLPQMGHVQNRFRSDKGCPTSDVSLKGSTVCRNIVTFRYNKL